MEVDWNVTLNLEDNHYSYHSRTVIRHIYTCLDRLDRVDGTINIQWLFSWHKWFPDTKLDWKRMQFSLVPMQATCKEEIPVWHGYKVV